MAKIAAITGGSAGIGRVTATFLRERGYTIYELSRSGKSERGITHITTDITDEAAVRAAFEDIDKGEGRLDLLVNNAGTVLSGAVEFTDVRDAQSVFDLNLFGTLRCIKAALPLLRKSKGSKIINLSSMAGRFPVPFQAFYCASKSAISALSLSLANELKPFGIGVCAIMPGDTKTPVPPTRLKNEQGDDIYAGCIAKAVAVMENDEENGMSPLKVARAIYRVAERKNPPALLAVGVKYKLFMLLGRLLPARLANFVVGLMYR